jgi:ppGpp synthetase/RelA/SpoT-type nucleotidyltranferase
MASKTILVQPEEVSEFINTRAKRYVYVLDHLKSTFQKFKYSLESREAIYSIYSRKEKQQGDEFKEAWKIANKVNSARTVGNPNKGIPPNPDFAIQDISDIIGLTVVVVYPSHIDTVKTFVQSKKGNELTVYDEEEKSERGYKAYHYVLGVVDPQYPGIKCEVQIKTILHDAWSAKTHDLTYKPQGTIGPELPSQFECLSDALSVIDRQSESLKRQIEEIWYVDEKRKNAAKHALMRGMTSQKADSQERQDRYEELLRDLLENESTYREGDVTEVVKKLKAFAELAPYDFHACRLFTLLGTMRAKDYYDYLALDCIDRWVTRQLDGAEKIRAVTFKSLSHFCFNHIREAIDASEEALKLAREIRDQNLIVRGLLNTAYFLAEIAGTPDSAEARRAKELLAEATALCGGADKLLANRKDTVGLIKVITGLTEAEVREGFDLCREAFNENADKDTAQAFFCLAERRAFRRLLEFD